MAVGRALALLGYAGSGEIASSEEMEEYLKFQEDKKRKILEEAKEKLEFVKHLNELKEVWISLPAEAKAEFEGLKNELKAKLEKLEDKNDNQ